MSVRYPAHATARHFPALASLPPGQSAPIRSDFPSAQGCACAASRRSLFALPKNTLPLPILPNAANGGFQLQAVQLKTPQRRASQNTWHGDPSGSPALTRARPPTRAPWQHVPRHADQYSQTSRQPLKSHTSQSPRAQRQAGRDTAGIRHRRPPASARTSQALHVSHATCRLSVSVYVRMRGA